MSLTIKATPAGLTFSVQVQPRAGRAAIAGEHGNALKIRLTAAPVEGAANKQCIEILAKALQISKSRLAIVGGRTHRLKQVCIAGGSGPLTPEEQQTLRQKLDDLARGASP